MESIYFHWWRSILDVVVVANEVVDEVRKHKKNLFIFKIEF